MTPLESLMREWLATGTPEQRGHAAERLKRPFLPEPPPGPATPPAAPRRPPPLAARVANFTRAAVKHVAAGMPTLPQAAVDARLAVCEGCDQRLPGGTCAGCGCNLRIAASWADKDCPLKKWPAP